MEQRISGVGFLGARDEGLGLIQVSAGDGGTGLIQ
jgi:hypothetical protein